jgi:hypothetical protein
MTWRDAFLKQAHSDYSIYRQLNEFDKTELIKFQGLFCPLLRVMGIPL